MNALSFLQIIQYITLYTWHKLVKKCSHLDEKYFFFTFFSSPGQNPGRAIVLPPALALVLAAAALAKRLTLKFFM